MLDVARFSERVTAKTSPELGLEWFEFLIEVSPATELLPPVHPGGMLVGFPVEN